MVHKSLGDQKVHWGSQAKDLPDGGKGTESGLGQVTYGERQGLYGLSTTMQKHRRLWVGELYQWSRETRDG